MIDAAASMENIGTNTARKCRTRSFPDYCRKKNALVLLLFMELNNRVMELISWRYGFLQLCGGDVPELSVVGRSTRKKWGSCESEKNEMA